jgi:hypothetical protein
VEGTEISHGRMRERLGDLRRQTVCIADITTDKRIPHDLHENTFVRSLVMAPAEKNPPVGALGIYWSRVHQASPQEVTTVEAMAEASGAAIVRIRCGLRSRSGNEAIAVGSP